MSNVTVGQAVGISGREGDVLAAVGEHLSNAQIAHRLQERLRVAAPAGAESDWAAACLARARGRLHDDPDALRESVAAWERIGARFERAVTLLFLPDRAAEGRDELAALGCARPAV